MLGNLDAFLAYVGLVLSSPVATEREVSYLCSGSDALRIPYHYYFEGLFVHSHNPKFQGRWP